MKRWTLLIATNLLIMLMLGVVMVLLQAFTGLDSSTWLGFLPMALVFGFGGAFVSLALSKTIAKWTTGAKVISSPSTPTEAWLMETVSRQAKDAGIPMPEVAIYAAPEPNAFATGPSRRNSLVAVSTGLMDAMNRDEVEAVLAHEVSHVANGDMVTMTLLQGVLNTFVILMARALGMFIDRVLLRTDSGTGPGYFVGWFAGQIIFGLMAAVVVNWFSRQREFRADAGAAALSSPEKMASALRRLGGQETSSLPQAIQAFGINGGLRGLLSSHPPIADRIAALEKLRAMKQPGRL